MHTDPTTYTVNAEIFNLENVLIHGINIINLKISCKYTCTISKHLIYFALLFNEWIIQWLLNTINATMSKGYNRKGHIKIITAHSVSCSIMLGIALLLVILFCASSVNFWIMQSFKVKLHALCIIVPAFDVLPSKSVLLYTGKINQSHVWALPITL